MGFIKETYSNNRAGLIVAFKDIPNTSTYVNTDSIEEAIKYFNLIIKDNVLYAITDSDIAMQKLDIKVEEAGAFRSQVNTLLATLDDDAAIQNIILYPIWTEGQNYNVNDRVRYNNVLYRVLQSHTSQSNWTPSTASSLFARVLTSENSIAEWVQPDSTNGYMTNDQVYHNGKVWTSIADNNVWEPGTVGAPWISDLEAVGQVEEFIGGNNYSIGDRVKFEGLVYESTIDNNVWSPADYPAGWTQVIE